MLNCLILIEKLLKINQFNLLVEIELNKLKTFDSCYFIGKSHFNNEDGIENYLVLQPLNKYFKFITNTMFHHGNLKDYLLKVLNHLQHLILFLLQY